MDRRATLPGVEADGAAAAPERTELARPDAEAAALSELRQRLCGLTERFGGEADALCASWGALREQLLHGQRPWRQSQRRLQRLAGGLLSLAPRMEAALARSGRISGEIARLGASLSRNQQHHARNQAALETLRQRLQQAKTQFLEGYEAARSSVAAHAEDSRERDQALEESRLVLSPLAEVVRARKRRLEVGLARQNALGQRIADYQAELARQTGAQEACGRLQRRLSRALALLEKRLESETRAVMAEDSRQDGLVQDQRRAVREGRERIALLDAELRSADSLAGRLEESRRNLEERLERLDGAEALRQGPVAALGEQLSRLDGDLAAPLEAPLGPPLGQDEAGAAVFGPAWLESAGLGGPSGPVGPPDISIARRGVERLLALAAGRSAGPGGILDALEDVLQEALRLGPEGISALVAELPGLRAAAGLHAKNAAPCPAVVAASADVPAVAPAATPNDAADARTLLARLAAQEKALEEHRRLEAEAGTAAWAAEQELAALKERVEGQDRLLEEYRRRLREAEQQLQAEATRLARVARERDLAEQQAQRTRQSLSYRLGELLQGGFGSWAGLRALPAGLVALRREHARNSGEERMAVTMPIPEDGAAKAV